jgi:hypothetical protein
MRRPAQVMLEQAMLDAGSPALLPCTIRMPAVQRREKMH